MAPARTILRAAALALLAMLATAVRSPAQEAAADSAWYDFWPGAWYRIEDGERAEAPTFVVRRDVRPAAFLEEWRLTIDGEPSRSTGYRVWDAAAGRWTFFWSSDRGHVQLWEGRKVNGIWGIERPFEQEGRRFVSRQSWIPEGPDQVRRVFERSIDEGRTWEPRLEEIYARGPLPPAGGPCQR
ncbi:MAG TPA: hypothetical protein VM778_14910 [Gemmatimonadota bacterium]|nr:hypothetical protein [Gemmatimonadota bacterium]